MFAAETGPVVTAALKSLVTPQAGAHTVVETAALPDIDAVHDVVELVATTV